MPRKHRHSEKNLNVESTESSLSEAEILIRRGHDGIDTQTGTALEMADREQKALEELIKEKKPHTGRLHPEYALTGRRRPYSQLSFSRLIAKAGNLRVVQRTYNFREAIRNFFLTKEITQDSTDMELRLRSAYTELLLLVLYISCLLIIVYGRQNPFYFFLTNSLRMTLEQKFSTNTDGYIYFKDIKSVGDIWGYMDNVILPFTYNEVYYHPKLHVVEQEYVEKLVIYENLLVGAPRLRIINIRKDSCTIPHAFRRAFRQCYGPYSESIEDSEKMSCSQPNCLELYYKNSIEYENFWGRYATYGKNGYEFIMPRKDSRRCKQVFDDAKVNKNWFTRGTRAIFIDYLLYNVNVNLFSKIQISFELPPTGGVESQINFKTVCLFPYQYQSDYIIAAFEIILFFYAIYYIMEEIREIVYLQMQYFALVSDYIDLWLSTQALLAAIYTLLRMTSFPIKIARECRKGIVGGDYWFALWFLYEYIQDEWLYNKQMGILIFLANLKFTRFLHLSPYLSTVLLVLRRCFKYCFGLLIMFCLVFFSFTNLGYFLFGGTAESFSSFFETTLTLITIMLGEFDYHELEQMNLYLGPLFLIFYVFLVYFTLLNMFMAIVKETYTTVRLGRTAGEPPPIPMRKYFDRLIFNLFRCIDAPTGANHEKEESLKTINDMKNSLLRHNFSLTEIDMLIAKYGIDNRKSVSPADVHKILEDLESKGLWPTSLPKLNEVSIHTFHEALLDEDVIKKKYFDTNKGFYIKNYDELMSNLEMISNNIKLINSNLVRSILTADRAEKLIWSNQKRIFVKKRAAKNAAKKRREELLQEKEDNKIPE